MRAHRLLQRTDRLLIAAGILVVLTGLAVGAILPGYVGLHHDAFRDRSLAYVQAFAATAEPWLDRGAVDVVETLSQVFVSGSVVSLEVVHGDRSIVSAGDPLPAEPATSFGHADRRTASGRRVVDVSAPLPSLDGHVRAAIDVSSVTASTRRAIVLGVGGAVLFDATVLGLVAWALRGARQRPAAPVEAARSPSEAPALRLGELAIIPSRREASFAGRPLRLTPKEYALLTLLAAEPGRVFAEQEILAAVWPDSPYADARDIKQYIYLLRRKLSKADPRGRDVIVNVPGFGYRLEDAH
ncbi:MAG: winged helix-turn-helix domain-containing protein [Candidatus Bipolaricaulota bacterium]